MSIVRTLETMSELLTTDVIQTTPMPEGFGGEQMKDADLEPYLTCSAVPADAVLAQRILDQAPLFTVADGVLYIRDARQKAGLRIVVPCHLREELLTEYHAGRMAGHFSGPRLYKTLEHRWWWQGMYADWLRHAKKCPQCFVVGSNVRTKKPPLCSRLSVSM